MTTGALSALALTWSAAFASTAMWAALRSKRAARSTSEPVARATLIRPCAGDEPALARALGSTALAARSFPMAVRFAVASLTDTATPAAEAARGQLRASGLDAEVVVTGARGPNRKADQLARTLDREPCAPIVIVADSDVDLTGLPLDDLVAALASPGVGAVWATPVEVAASTGADRASAAVLDASLHAFPLLAALDPRGVVGKLFAVRADALARIGGFGELVAHLGEDMELGRRLRAAGLRTVIAPFVAPSLAQGRSWAMVIERYARWISVIRAQRPALLLTYPALLFAAPLLVTLSLLAAYLDGPLALAATALTVAARVLVAWRARALGGRSLGGAALARDIVLSDVLLLAAFTRALCTRAAVWRGVRLLPGANGTFVEEAP